MTLAQGLHKGPFFVPAPWVSPAPPDLSSHWRWLARLRRTCGGEARISSGLETCHLTPQWGHQSIFAVRTNLTPEPGKTGLNAALETIGESQFETDFLETGHNPKIIE